MRIVMVVNQESFNGKTTFTVIGDVHGNYASLMHAIAHSIGPIMFVGDFTDYRVGGDGYDNIKVINKVHELISTGRAMGIIGNHDNKVYRASKAILDNGEWGGSMSHGLDRTIQDLKDHGMMQFYVNDFYPNLKLFVHSGDNLFSHSGYHPAMIYHGPFRKSSMRKLMDASFYSRIIGETGMNDWVNTIPNGMTLYRGHEVVDGTNVIETESGSRIVTVNGGAGKTEDGIVSYMVVQKKDTLF